MEKKQEQKMLLKIVEAWNPSEKPEYRGFRCANCQEYKNEAWYHWVNTDDYKLPVHMCKETCEPAFQNESIQVDEAKRTIVKRETFGGSFQYSKKAQKRFAEIVASWPEYKEPELKAYVCDDCGEKLDIDTDDMRKGYHVWWKMSDTKILAELHFHKHCGDSLNLSQ